LKNGSEDDKKAIASLVTIIPELLEFSSLICKFHPIPEYKGVDHNTRFVSNSFLDVHDKPE
jgi:hypothetical protein